MDDFSDVTIPRLKSTWRKEEGKKEKKRSEVSLERNEDSRKASRLFAYPRREREREENWTNSYSTSHPNAEKFTER